MGWAVVGTAVLGAPRFCIFLWKNVLFGQKSGQPKTAVPTTTHPIPHLTPSEKLRAPPLKKVSILRIFYRFEPFFLILGPFRGGVYQHRAFPLHKHLHTLAFGFADAQVDLALAEIEKGFSLPSEKQSNSKHSS